MSRDLMDGNYYISHGGQIPIKWTAPEVILCIVWRVGKEGGYVAKSNIPPSDHTISKGFSRVSLRINFTYPEIYTMNKSIVIIIMLSITYRLSTSRSTPLLVMCGVMELSCMRYGVWDTNHLKVLLMSRYTTSLIIENIKGSLSWK